MCEFLKRVVNVVFFYLSNVTRGFSSLVYYLLLIFEQFTMVPLPVKNHTLVWNVSLANRMVSAGELVQQEP
jgi:hypothetical protein